MPRPLFLLSRLARFTLTASVGAALWSTSVSAQSTPPPSLISGVVVDESGGALVRASVRLLDAAARPLATTATDDRGRFTVEAPSGVCPSCRIEVALAGFLAGSADVASQPVQVTLKFAPVRETVVVSATRGEAPSGLLGSAVTVIDRDDITRRGAPVVAELLRSTPGMTMVQTGGLGTVTSAYVRGGESDYNKVLLDGIPLNEPGGAFSFGALTTAGLERIEIVRGPMSALFGSDAMSSVIHLVSARARSGSRPSGSFDIEGGSYGTGRIQGTAGLGVGRWDLSATVGGLHTDNRVPNSALGQTTLTASVGGPVGGSDRVTIRGVFRMEDQRVGVPGQTAFGRPDLDASFDRQDAVGGITITHRAGPKWRQRFTTSVNRSVQLSSNLIADPPYVPTFGSRAAPFAFFDFTFESRNVLKRYATSYQSDWFLGAHHASARQILTVAVDIDAQRALLEDRLEGTSLPASRDNVGFTLQHQFGSPRTSTTAGLRVERNASFGTTVVPRVSIGHLVRLSPGAIGDTLLRASAGLGIKEPTILESFSRNFFFLGNPDLEPERSRSVDVGIEQRLFDQRAKVEATWFDSRYRNQISTQVIDDATFQGRYFNIGRTRARGLELAAETQLVDGFRVSGGYTFLASTIVESTSPTSPVFKVGAWTFRRPRHSGFVNLSFTHARVSIDAVGLFTGRRVDSDFSSLAPPLVEADLPAVWTLGARIRVTPRLEGYLRMENLTDADYMEPMGYEAWRRTAHAGLRLTF
jgi:vitamin B12 transporter